MKKDRAAQLEELLDAAYNGDAPLGVNISLPEPALIEITGHFAFDYILIDQEHTTLGDTTQLATLARTADLTGLPWFVKVAQSEHLRIRDAMDAGAWGVMLPHISTAKQLKELMHDIRLPPHGHRGFCSLSRTFGHVGRAKYSNSKARPMLEYRDFVNEHMWIIPTIESVEGIENLDDILEVPGYKIVHIGLEDIWMSLNGGQDMAAAKALAADVARRLREAGKIAMTFTDSDQARMEEKSSMVYVPDVWFLADGMLTCLEKHGRRDVDNPRVGAPARKLTT